MRGLRQLSETKLNGPPLLDRSMPRLRTIANSGRDLWRGTVALPLLLGGLSGSQTTIRVPRIGYAEKGTRKDLAQAGAGHVLHVEEGATQLPLLTTVVGVSHALLCHYRPEWKSNPRSRSRPKDGYMLWQERRLCMACRYGLSCDHLSYALFDPGRRISYLESSSLIYLGLNQNRLMLCCVLLPR
ncbi:hypothetical protein NL676_018277 [Syzygium grande]|nr:hypothetical protein NL676_018277 [Syzygium grande]